MTYEVVAGFCEGLRGEGFGGTFLETIQTEFSKTDSFALDETLPVPHLSISTTRPSNSDVRHV